MQAELTNLLLKKLSKKKITYLSLLKNFLKK